MASTLNRAQICIHCNTMAFLQMRMSCTVPSSMVIILIISNNPYMQWKHCGDFWMNVQKITKFIEKHKHVTASQRKLQPGPISRCGSERIAWSCGPTFTVFASSNKNLSVFPNKKPFSSISSAISEWLALFILSLYIPNLCKYDFLVCQINLLLQKDYFDS